MKYMFKTACLGLMVMAAIGLTGCSSKVVPAGTIVVVRKADGESIIAAKGTYLAAGRDKVYFVDTKLASKSVKLDILCKDDINMKVEVKWIGSLDVDASTVETVCEKIPSIRVDKGDMIGYQLSFDLFWDLAMSDVVAGTSKRVVAPYITDDINDNRDKIEADIKEKTIAKLKAAGYPVTTSDVLVTNLDYPDEVTASRKAIKQAELKDLENAAIAKANVTQAARDAELALARNKAKLVDAQGDAAANFVRSESLTPAILALKWQEALIALANGPNNSSVIVPYEAVRPELLDTAILKQSVDIPVGK